MKLFLLSQLLLVCVWCHDATMSVEDVMSGDEPSQLEGDKTETHNSLPVTQGLREGRSLLNTFPFNQHLDPDFRSPIDDFSVSTDDFSLSTDDFSLIADSKQGSSDVSFDAIAAAGTGADGGERRCIDKLIMEEQIVWDDVEECSHSYNKRCFKTLITTYHAAQEEECDDNFVKNCFIEYSQAAVKETVSVCRTPLVKDCDKEGEEICSTQYESECVTKQEKHEVDDDIPECTTVHEEKCNDITSGYTSSTECTKWPKEVCSLSKEKRTKFSPITACEKVPVTLCGPAGCGFTEGEEECTEKTQTVVIQNPEENCSLDPQKTCKHVTKLVPSLEQIEKCIDVPKEVCVRSQRNPRKVPKPVVKKWCYGTPPKTTRPPGPGPRTTTRRTTTRRTTTRRTTTPRTRQTTTPGYGRTTTRPTTTRRTTTRRTTTRRTTTRRTTTPRTRRTSTRRTTTPRTRRTTTPRNSRTTTRRTTTRRTTTRRTTTRRTTTRRTNTRRTTTKRTTPSRTRTTPPGDTPQKCPAKCTSKRASIWVNDKSSEKCRSDGVPECDNIVGCCPEHYDVLFGAVAFDGSSEDSSREK